ncbi:MAG: dihydroorotate dehydrogenase [archaeon]|nr:dihydroorotate dehydrogenase [archaeon]
MKPELSTNLCGIKLDNPTVLASGIIGNTGELLKRVGDEGAGAVTTKSISLKPWDGHPSPNVVELKNGLLNAMGLPNPGAEEFIEEIKTAKEGDALVIVSVVESSIQGYADVISVLESAEPDMYELNASCPNVKGGQDISRSPELAGKLLEKACSVTNAPISFKISPDAGKLTDVARAVDESGASAITAVNTLPAKAIDSKTNLPILSNTRGGLSGELLRPIALRCVSEISDAVEIPIIGTGGVSTGQHAAEMMSAGARAVGIGTAVWHHGVGVFKKVSDELSSIMESRGFENVEAIEHGI